MYTLINKISRFSGCSTSPQIFKTVFVIGKDSAIPTARIHRVNPNCLCIFLGRWNTEIQNKNKVMMLLALPATSSAWIIAGTCWTSGVTTRSEREAVASEAKRIGGAKTSQILSNILGLLLTAFEKLRSPPCDLMTACALLGPFIYTVNMLIGRTSVTTLALVE